MARRTLLLLLLAAALAVASTAAPVFGREADAGWNIRRAAKNCRGTVAECMGDADEYEVGGDGGARRRLDGATQFISYSSLRADDVPCSVRGASYYNCQPGADANPYTRGCSAITQCRD